MGRSAASRMSPPLLPTAPGERVVAAGVVWRVVHHHAQPAVCHLYNFRLDLYGGHASDGSCICCNCDAVAEDGKFCLASLLYTSHIDVNNAGKVHEHEKKRK